MSERDIYQDIRLYFNGHMKSALKAIAEYTVSPSGYFAHRLYRSMKGLGTDDNSLTRVIVTRSEVCIFAYFVELWISPQTGWPADRIVLCPGSPYFPQCLKNFVREFATDFS